MLTVKIKSGAYGLNTGDRVITKDRMSEPFSLDDAEAKRLVSLGVAEIITEGVATGGNGEKTNPPSVNPSKDGNGSNGENEGGNKNITLSREEELKEMTNKELKALADGMGIDTSKMKVKAEYIQAIVAVESSASDDDENGENPPNISPEAPVV